MNKIVYVLIFFGLISCKEKLKIQEHAPETSERVDVLARKNGFDCKQNNCFLTNDEKLFNLNEAAMDSLREYAELLRKVSNRTVPCLPESLVEVYDDPFLRQQLIKLHSNHDSLVSKTLKSTDVLTYWKRPHLFKGKVVDKIRLLDMNKCYYFKTQYSIVVQEILYKRKNNICVGDTILALSENGYMGNCSGNQHKQVKVNAATSEDYYIGESDFFALSSFDYQLPFYLKQTKDDVYQGCAYRLDFSSKNMGREIKSKYNEYKKYFKKNSN